MPFQRRGCAYSIGMGELGWWCETGLKSHGTLIDWCTGREWPLNCMTVISAWWRANMPLQRLSGRLNYYITRCKQEVSELEIRRAGDQKSLRQDVVEKATTQQKGPRDPRLSFGDQTRWWQDVVEKASTQQKAEPPGPRLSSPGERERHTVMSGGAGEVNMLQSLFSLQLPLTHKPYNKVRGIFFKEVFARLYSLRQYVFCMNICIVIIWGYNRKSFALWER